MDCDKKSSKIETMNRLIALSMTSSLSLSGAACFRERQARRVAVIFAIILLAGILTPCAFVSGSPVLQIQTELGGVSMAKAAPDKLGAAVKLAVAANAKVAAAILTEALSVERADIPLIAGLLAGAAIEGLGPEPTEASVILLVRLAVELEPDSILSIVRAAVRATPNSMAPAVVKAAVASARHPTAETVRQVVDAALHAKTELRRASDGKNVVVSEDGKNVVPPEDGKNVVSLEDGKDVIPPEDPQALEDAANQGLNGQDLANAFNHAVTRNGPQAIPPLPPGEPGGGGKKAKGNPGTGTIPSP